ncbi:hypothetical protein AVEN_166674-1 [Araneus ventricosus]|uniref:Uncharacterized protein n=1 Tax=Araneus ventricosus TaxID=182803 RepID=A0A4Y2K0W9_ARAVE|nr:hypothetical protein AVEN_166674-1 [Araneus ventricosus]
MKTNFSKLLPIQTTVWIASCLNRVEEFPSTEWGIESPTQGPRTPGESLSPSLMKRFIKQNVTYVTNECYDYVTNEVRKKLIFHNCTSSSAGQNGQNALNQHSISILVG